MKDRLAASPQSRARPAPVLHSLHQTRTQRVPFNITQDGQEVVALLDRKGPKTALVHVSAAVVVLMITADMGGKQPAHVIAQVAVAARPEDEMEVVGHEAIGQEADRDAFAGLAEQLEEGSEIAVLVEDGAARVPAVENVVAVTAQGSASIARHGGEYAMGRAAGQE